MNGPWRILDGIELSVERRRYDTTTYTWVYARLNEGETWEQWVSLGDPWPCITPKLSEVRESLNMALAGRVIPSYYKEAA